MIAISLKKDEFNFLSANKHTNQLACEDFGNLSTSGRLFSPEHLLKIKNRKKIKNSKYPSKNCILLLDSSEVILNQFKCPDELSVDDFISWYEDSMFGANSCNKFSGYHYEIEKNFFLSIYIKKEKQFELNNLFLKQNLNLKAISLGIFSANYLAKTQFDADSNSGYMIWSLGKKDEILIIKDGIIECLFNAKRKSNKLDLINFIGSSKKVKETIQFLNEKMATDLKSFDLADKIYIYQNSPSSGINKILNKKNKDSVTILNPLAKMENLNRKKVNMVESSYLAEMGYLFKTIDRT